MYKKKVKKLVERIKKVVFRLIRVNRIRSKDIKIIVLTKKAKAAFLKDIK